MKRFLIRYTPILILLCSTGGFLLQTSQNVQNTESKLRALEHSIAREKQNLIVLEAEWAYLNSPYRLENLALKYLELTPPKSASINKTQKLSSSLDNSHSIIFTPSQPSSPQRKTSHDL